MLVSIQAGALTVRGISLGGIFTSLHVPELGCLFDVGIPIVSAAAVDHIFLSHGHADHAGSLAAVLGIRALAGKRKPPSVYMPREIVDDLLEALGAMARLQRYNLEINAVGMSPGDEVTVRGNLRARAMRTYHPVPSLAYALVREIPKLRPEFRDLPGHEIATRRRAGEDLFKVETRCELAYATDTLVEVLDREPMLSKANVLILECTFLDDKKPVDIARRGCHIHLDELLERADRLVNPAIVLMHFSQLYKPADVHRILEARCPPQLLERLHPLVSRR